MFLNVVSLLVGFLCLFVVLLILFNQKPNRKINGYLIAILVIVGLQRFLYAIEVLGFTNQTYSPLKIKPILAFYIVPIYYLFFYRLINSKVSFKKESLHFLIDDKNIAELSEMDIADLSEWFGSLEKRLNDRQNQIAVAVEHQAIHTLVVLPRLERALSETMITT